MCRAGAHRYLQQSFQILHPDPPKTPENRTSARQVVRFLRKKRDTACIDRGPRASRVLLWLSRRRPRGCYFSIEYRNLPKRQWPKWNIPRVPPSIPLPSSHWSLGLGHWSFPRSGRYTPATRCNTMQHQCNQMQHNATSMQPNATLCNIDATPNSHPTFVVTPAATSTSDFPLYLTMQHLRVPPPLPPRLLRHNLLYLQGLCSHAHLPLPATCSTPPVFPSRIPNPGS